MLTRAFKSGNLLAVRIRTKQTLKKLNKVTCTFL